MSLLAQPDSLRVEEESEFDAPNDSTVITSRSFDSTLLKTLKADPDLNYKQPPTVAESLWERILYWIGRFLSNLLEGATMNGIGRILMYTLALILVIAIILTVLKVNAFRVLYSGADQNKFNASIFHENIHVMDFEKLVREATEKQDFRQATRWILLHALRLLSDQHLIQWEAGKTNHDYVDEVKSPELKTGLNEISFYFDYAWYGNFPVSAEAFLKVQHTFDTWRQKLNNR